MTFDDRLWDHVWERNLSAVERHGIAMAVWRRRRPDGIFEAMVACELARRWRRHALTLMIVYALWTTFWGSIAVHDFRPDAALSSTLTVWCATVGLLAIGCCVAARRHLASYIRVHATPR